MSDRDDARSADAAPRSTGSVLLEVVTVAIGLFTALGVLVVLVRLAPRYLEEQPVAGALLMIAAAPLTVVVMDLWSPLRRRGMWLVGAVASLGATLVYAVTLALGLPDGRAAWWDDWALAGLGLVAAYLLAMAVWFAAHRATARSGRVVGHPARRQTWKRHHPTASGTA
jgi:hypothetical protein